MIKLVNRKVRLDNLHFLNGSVRSLQDRLLGVLQAVPELKVNHFRDFRDLELQMETGYEYSELWVHYQSPETPQEAARREATEVKRTLQRAKREKAERDLLAKLKAKYEP